MKKIRKGIVLGVIAGMIDVIPMIMQKLSWDACFSAFIFWIVCGFFIASSEIKVKGALKGIIISYATLLPAAIIAGKQDLKSLIPMSVMALILGSLLGWKLEK